MRARRLMSGLALALAVCAPAGPERAASARSQPQAHAVSGLEVVPLTIRHGGRSLRFRVEVARTPEQQARGLMYRRAMGADEGMIFPMQPPRVASFWMRNTLLPLDIIFIGVDGRIITIAANAEPLSDAPIGAGGVTGAVLELNGGRAAKLGIAPGDRVAW